MSEKKQTEGESDQKASSGTPPLYPGSNNSSKVPSGSGSKTRRPSSNAPSRSSTNESGEQHLDKHFRSILFHPLGLPLACALHGKDPGRLDYLRQESEYFPNNKQAYDNILEDVLAAWTTKAETDLTSFLTTSINSNVNTLKAKREVKVGEGRVDILLRKDEESRPLMLVEVGLDGNDWWKKFDQCLKYLNMIQQAEPPLLLGVMTVDKSQKKTADKSQQQTTDKSENEPIEVKLGVFLCLWSGEEDNNNKKKNLRISLLWHSKTCNRGDASKAFGRLLRGVCDFSWWIERVDSQRNDSQYEYFGSSCCRVGDMVLRSYDNRSRKTHRSPDIYLSEACKGIVGEGAKTIFKVPVDESSWNIVSNDFWEPSRNRSLRVIATPFRHGCHYAKEPKSFLPIIDQLDMLHQKGYVHGDIRGFNTVFGDDSSQGYLIDFDFGGEAGTREFPNGYRNGLTDGKRKGKGGDKIHPWHDWHALGRLIFEVHKFIPKDWSDPDLAQLPKLNDLWDSISEDDPTPEMIDELKKNLSRIQGAGWTVKPTSTYADDLKEVEKPRQTTNVCATGSPPGKQP